MMNYTFDQINNYTGFANGRKFKSFEELINYFTTENMIAIFGETDSMFNQNELTRMASVVAANKWHMEIE